MKVSDKYNSLAVFESRITRRKKTYPVHKKLDFGKSGSAKICEDINDWLAERYMPPENSRILDAGCGNGKTLFTFCRIKNITGMGISQSEVEISLAKKMAEALGYDQVCTFAVKNYDEPLHERFDLIMAIESLKHSKNLEYTVSNLCSSLNQGGLFIVVEDLLSGSFQEGYFRKLLMKHWSLQELYLEDDYHAAMHHQELQIKEMTDLTDMVPRRTRILAAVYVYLFGIVRMVTLWPFARRIFSIFQAGFVMEYLYATGKMKYKVLVYRKNSISFTV